MNCKHCNKEFEPLKLYCGVNCRVSAHRAKHSANSNSGVTIELESNSDVTYSDAFPVDKTTPTADTQPIKIKRVGKRESTEPFGMCSKHNAFYQTCHC